MPRLTFTKMERKPTLITHNMKFVTPLCALVLIGTACRHVQPERRSTDAEIRQHIVGEWTSSNNSDGMYPMMIISKDGSLTAVLPDGTRKLMGSWELSGGNLRVTPSTVRQEAARVAGVHMNG